MKTIPETNGVYGNTMNNGLVAAIGEYFSVPESDDLILLDAFFYNNAKWFDADMVGANYLFLYYSRRKAESPTGAHLPELYLVLPMDLPPETNFGLSVLSRTRDGNT